LAELISEGLKPGGGIPERAGALDRLRNGISRGADQPPLMIAPRDENRIARLIFDPEGAKEAAALINTPIKPWVSDAERLAVQIGVPAGGLGAIMLAANQMRGGPEQSEASKQPVNGAADRPVYTVPDRLMGTSNPAEPPAELNGLNTDTRFRAQQRLMALGYAPKNLGNGSRFDDGIDGPELRKAVADFQLENNLPVTGDLDPMTLRALWGGRNYSAKPVLRNYGEELAPAPQ